MIQKAIVMIQKAIDKLNAERKKFKGGNKEKAMLPDVCNALECFCKQEEEFAQAIVQNDNTLSDCLADVAKGVMTHISDLNAYKKAVRFYFPGADIEFIMRIKLNGAAAEAPDITMTSKSKKSVLEMSLDDLF